MSLSVGLLATVPSVPPTSNGNGHVEMSTDGMGFPAEAAHNAAAPSGECHHTCSISAFFMTSSLVSGGKVCCVAFTGYQMPVHSQGDWQNSVMMYRQGDHQTSVGTHQQGEEPQILTHLIHPFYLSEDTLYHMCFLVFSPLYLC